MVRLGKAQVVAIGRLAGSDLQIPLPRSPGGRGGPTTLIAARAEAEPAGPGQRDAGRDTFETGDWLLTLEDEALDCGVVTARLAAAGGAHVTGRGGVVALLPMKQRLEERDLGDDEKGRVVLQSHGSMGN